MDYSTGAVRNTGGKGRCDLLPHAALLRVSKHIENSLDSYPERNWEKGLPMHTMLDSAMRHIFKYMDGQNDEDHLAAAATNLLMALWTEEKRPEQMDIPTRENTEEEEEELTMWDLCDKILGDIDGFPVGVIKICHEEETKD